MDRPIRESHMTWGPCPYDDDGDGNCGRPYCAHCRTPLALLSYPFGWVRINDEDRRGYQLSICTEGSRCCSPITVIRIPALQGWSDAMVLWGAASGPRPDYAVQNFINGLQIAREIGPGIPR